MIPRAPSGGENQNKLFPYDPSRDAFVIMFRTLAFLRKRGSTTAAPPPVPWMVSRVPESNELFTS